MCVRFFIDTHSDELDEIVEKARATKTGIKLSHLWGPVKDGEIRPTDIAPVIAPAPSGKPKIFAMKWGYSVPGKTTILFNARSETAAIRPTFKEDWLHHRCIVPASYYYEWEHLTDEKGRKKSGSRYLIQPKGQDITYLCGLYRVEDGYPYFIILTREPGEEISFIHNRMPLILPKEKIEEWTDPNSDPQRIIRCALTLMVADRG